MMQVCNVITPINYSLIYWRCMLHVRVQVFDLGYNLNTQRRVNWELAYLSARLLPWLYATKPCIFCEMINMLLASQLGLEVVMTPLWSNLAVKLEERRAIFGLYSAG